MCAIALALIGQSRVDEDKCLGAEGKSVTPATLPSLPLSLSLMEEEMEINREDGKASALLPHQTFQTSRDLLGLRWKSLKGPLGATLPSVEFARGGGRGTGEPTDGQPPEGGGDEEASPRVGVCVWGGVGSDRSLSTLPVKWGWWHMDPCPCMERTRTHLARGAWHSG